VYARPLHPYTQALLAAVPVPDPRQRRTQPMPEGEIPNPIHPPAGCRFHPRCPLVRPECSSEEPGMVEIEPDHWVACHLCWGPRPCQASAYATGAGQVTSGPGAPPTPG